jgi:hypothetical protein
MFELSEGKQQNTDGLLYFEEKIIIKILSAPSKF